MNDFANMWDFCVKDGVHFPNCNRVHPLMQENVQTVLETLTEDSNIKRIVLFGSALEFRCSSHSDLDIYIEKENHELPLKREPDVNCEIDYVIDLPPDSRLFLEIQKKGLLLYEKENEHV